MRSFHNATNMSAVEEAICGVCARRLNKRTYEVKRVSIDLIPNIHRLKPVKEHSKHDLFEGALLEPEGVDTEHQSKTVVNICIECHKSLNSTTDRPPPHSLASGLWLGSVPFELRSLTLPEALLVAQVYPRTFVCKLWPKDRRGANPSNLQSALKGNVTSFELNTQSISDMVSGNLMPRQTSILASLISITIISRFPLPPSWLKGTFRVRRSRIHAALIWLKANNPYYADIVIDESRLAGLPEDDVPQELINIVREDHDELNIERENDNYVPEDEVIDVPGTIY
jgi:hypothetical protein